MQFSNNYFQFAETIESWQRTDLYVESLFLLIQKWTRDYVRGLVDVVVGTPNTILKYHKKGNPVSAITCLKVKIETMGQGVKYVQS